MKQRIYRIFIVAAESSGDNLGAALMTSLKKTLGDQVQFYGVGGIRMEAEGIRSPVDISGLSILGIFEVLKAYKYVMESVRKTVEHAIHTKPDIVILIDSWGYTLRVARGLKKRKPDIPVIKYVGPQVWAARPGRVYTLAKYVDHLMSIHYFEAPYFKNTGLKTSFVGNPVLAEKKRNLDRNSLRSGLGIDKKAPVLALLIGSRASEVNFLHETLDTVIIELKKRIKGLKIISPLAESIKPQLQSLIKKKNIFKEVIWLNENQKYEAFSIADIALACSGTIITELSMAGVPSIVVYRVHPLTAMIVRHIIKTPYVSLVNIAMNEEVLPEFIQGNCRVDKIVDKIDLFLKDRSLYEDCCRKLKKAIEIMRGGIKDPALSAAETVVKILQKERKE